MQTLSDYDAQYERDHRYRVVYQSDDWRIVYHTDLHLDVRRGLHEVVSGVTLYAYDNQLRSRWRPVASSSVQDRQKLADRLHIYHFTLPEPQYYLDSHTDADNYRYEHN